MLAAQIPTYFREDLMRLAGERRRPPHRSGPLELTEALLCMFGARVCTELSRPPC
jgi:hypothetical protein